jgi:hypothetical protein
VHGVSNGAHTHPPSAFTRQVWLVGHAPAHAGAPAALHATETGTQAQVAPED